MKDHSIVPAHLAVKAMRDNGYKNAAYAIAELIDNSIQHGSKNVELLCSEADYELNNRIVPRIHQIAVLDNGKGMDKETLRMALQFGNGTNLDPSAQTGIGKFGMGLPSSSVSQATKVEVWTWQSGFENAIYSYLDIEEVGNRTLTEVPNPIEKKIPKLWLEAGTIFGKEGTIVVWSNLDKCIWKTGATIIENSEFLVGRMYRKFIAQGDVKIRMAVFHQKTPKLSSPDKFALPNDPLYLMTKTSCPSTEGFVVPTIEEPLFKKWGGDEGFETKYIVPYKGGNHEVFLRFSYAKEEIRKGFQPGSRPYGKHAAKNVGVSIIRARRELDLDDSWAMKYEPTDRWWGAEIEFPPALDDIFGVTNNKQFANHFTDLSKNDLAGVNANDRSLIALKEEFEKENNPKALLLDIAVKLKTNISAIRGILDAQTRNESRSEKGRHKTPSDSAEQKATEATQELIKEGHIGTSDKQEEKNDEIDRKADVEKTLTKDGIENASELTERLFKTNLKYSFVDFESESYAFFQVQSRGGKIIISLNTAHPAYKNLVEALDKSTEKEDIEELKNRLSNASEGLKLLLMAWARYEDELFDEHKAKAMEARQDWGRIAKKFLKGE